MRPKPIPYRVPWSHTAEPFAAWWSEASYVEVRGELLRLLEVDEDGYAMVRRLGWQERAYVRLRWLPRRFWLWLRRPAWK